MSVSLTDRWYRYDNRMVAERKFEKTDICERPYRLNAGGWIVDPD